MHIKIRKPLFIKRLVVMVMGAAFVSAPCGRAMGAAPSFSIHPMRMEMEVSPGTEKTAAFEIRAALSSQPERGRVVVSLTDWTIREDGSASYLPPGSVERSASSWITFSPAALTTEPGRTQLVRVTANVPANAEPGVYRTALFIQDRPEATPPTADERAIHLRVRFAFTLYVIVPPVYSSPELVDIEVDNSKGPPRLTCDMRNSGSRHARPLVMWNIRDKSSTQVVAKGRIEATVLLPLSAVREPHSLQQEPLAPGEYEASVLVDFQDGRPLQSMTRAFSVAASPVPSQEVSPLSAPSFSEPSMPAVASPAVPPRSTVETSNSGPLAE